MRPSLVIHQTPAVTQECFLKRNHKISRLELVASAAAQGSSSLAPQPLDAEKVPLQRPALSQQGLMAWGFPAKSSAWPSPAPDSAPCEPAARLSTSAENSPG